LNCKFYLEKPLTIFLTSVMLQWNSESSNSFYVIVFWACYPTSRRGFTIRPKRL